MSDLEKEVAIKEIIKIRLKFLKKYSHRLKYVMILYLVSMIVLTCVKWIVIVPYFNKLFDLALMGDVDQIQYELEHMPILMKYSALVISLGLILLTISLFFLLNIIHNMSRIHYYMILDSIRILLFFAIIACGISTILWLSLSHAFISEDIEAVSRIIASIYFSERMYRLCFAMASILLSLFFYKNKTILRKIYNIRSIYLILILISSILSIIDIIFSLPLIVYMGLKRKIIYLVAYIDIYDKMQE